MKLRMRILALMSVVVLLSAVLIVPALAAPIDYNDYVTNVRVDGDNDLVTVKIPADMAAVFIFHVDDVTGEFTEVYRGEGAYHSVQFESWNDYCVRVCPLGYPFFATNGLDLSYIPVGTQIASGFGISPVGDWSAAASPYFTASYSYYQYGNSSPLKLVTHNLGQDHSWNFVTDTLVIESVDNANLLASQLEAYPFGFLEGNWVGIDVMDTTMVFSISSLLRQQQLTGKGNELLKEVSKQLADQGMTLDDIKQQQQDTNNKLDGIINGEVNGTPPAGSDIVDDYESAEDQLMDSVGGGSDAFQDMTLSAWDKIYAYSQSFLAFGVLFEMFSVDIPFFQGLLYISLSLGTFAFLVNLSAMAGRALTRRTAKRGGK